MLYRLIESFWTFFRGHRIIGRYADDIPEAIEPDIVYLIGKPATPWSAAMSCPCGCGALIQLSLLPDDRPRWKATRAFDGSVSLHPSVWRSKGCYSHFILRRGKIIWAKPGPPPTTKR